MTQERIDKIVSYLEETGESRAKLAQSAGIAPSTITQVLNGTYKGTVETMLSKMEDVIQNRLDKKAVTFKAPEFINTKVGRKIRNSLSEAQSVTIQRMLVLHGASGIGKTRTVEEWVKDNPTSILVEVSPDITFRALLQEIALEIGVSSIGTHYELRKRIVGKLKGSNRMLILDEAEHLTAKSLEIVRRLHDMAKIPVVLIGMPALYHTIKSLRKGHDQIANRMVSYNLGTPSREDMSEIIKSCLPSVEDGVENALIECSKNTIRTLIILMQDLVNFSEKTGKKITAKQVHSLVNSMH